MQEEEACQEEEISHKKEEEEVTDAEMVDEADAEMVDEEERDDPEPSDPHGEADTEGPLLWPLRGMLSPPRRMPSSCSRHPNPKI